MIIPKAPKIHTPKFNNGHWLFPEQMGIGMGFVYVVRDNYLERFYLGKKAYKVSRGRDKGAEANWRQYNTSSPILKEHFLERPLDEFDFICLEQYKTKGTVSYGETWTACLVETPTTDDWYNTRIEKVSWSVKEPISERHKERLKRVISMADFSEER